MWRTLCVLQCACILCVCLALQPARGHALAGPSPAAGFSLKQQQQQRQEANYGAQTPRSHQALPQQQSQQYRLPSHRPLAEPARAADHHHDHQVAVEPRTPLRVDKRSWSPRAIKAQAASGASQEEQAISLLLDEVASLDIDAANGSRTLEQRPQSAVDESSPSSSSSSSSSISSTPIHIQRQHEQHQQQLMPNGRMRTRSAGSGSSGGMGTSSGGGGGGGASGMPSFHVNGSHGAAGNLPRRASNRHLPCFFNAITCF